MHIAQELINVYANTDDCLDWVSRETRKGIPVGNTLTCLCPATKFDPAFQSKVDALCTVKSKINPGMITARIGDDELVFPLNHVVWSARRLG